MDYAFVGSSGDGGMLDGGVGDHSNLGDMVSDGFVSLECQEACSPRDPASSGTAVCPARSARSSSTPLAPPPQPRDGAALPRAPGTPVSTSVARLPLARSGARRPMTKDGCCLTTVNATSWGPLGEYLMLLDGGSTLAVAVQEHHRLERDLATQQKASKDAGWHGVWSAATPSSTSTTGTVGGVAVLAPTSVQVTAPPGRDSPVLVPGRLVAGHVRAGPSGGVVALSVYLHDGEGLSANNLGILWQLTQYLGQLEAAGYHWAVMGDWNMEVAQLDFGWIGKLKATLKVTDVPTCRQGSGSKIDYFVVSKSLAAFAQKPPFPDLGAGTWPHWPVHLPLCKVRLQTWQRVINEPKPIPREAAKPGCSRAPWRWDEFASCISATRDDEGLQILWDFLMEGIETEILNRRDLVGEARRTYAGRGTAGDASLRWVQVQWRPPQRRKRRGPAAHAWAAVSGWASWLLQQQGRLAKLLGQLQDHPLADTPKQVKARDKCLRSTAALLVHLQQFLEDIHDSDKDDDDGDDGGGGKEGGSRNSSSRGGERDKGERSGPLPPGRGAPGRRRWADKSCPPPPRRNSYLRLLVKIT